EVIAVGGPRSNMGVTAFSTAMAPRDPRHVEAFVEVTNASKVAGRAELRPNLDGALLQVVKLDLKPGQSDHPILHGIAVTGTGRLVARLAKIQFENGQSDALREDDEYVTTVARRATVPIDFIGENTPLKMVLAANPRYAVTTRLSPSQAAGHVTVIS